jgi:hypothetical protein
MLLPLTRGLHLVEWASAIALAVTVGCSGLKDDNMTDEDFIKISVRVSGEILVGGIDRASEPTLRDSNPLREFARGIIGEYVSVYKKVCEKYGYTLDAYRKKNQWVFSHTESGWIQSNIQVLSGILITIKDGLPGTDDEWAEFFIEQEKYLRRQ